MLKRSYHVLNVKSLDDDERILEGVATTPSPDVYGDIVEPDGVEFALPIPFLWQHKSGDPIGHVIAATVSKSGITVKVRIAKSEVPGKLKDRLDEAWQHFKAGLVLGLSIGFTGIDSEAIPNSWGVRFKKWRWLELSAVTIPANGDCSVTAIKAAFGHPDDQRPGATGRTIKPRQPVSLKEPPKMAKNTPLADQLARLESKHASNLARIEELLSKSADNDRTMDDAEADEHDALRDENERLSLDIGRVRQAIDAKAKTARPADPATRGNSSPAPRVEVRAPLALTRKQAPGIPFARMVRCRGLSYLEHMPAVEIAKNLYPEDVALHGVLTKAAVAAGTTAHSTWASPLVGDETTVFADFVEFLRPQTIVGRFGVGGIPALRQVPFRTRLVGQSSGGSGYWVGEGAGKPLTKFDFTGTTLAPLKVANIAVITMELLRDSSPSAEMLVRDQLAAALRERMDIDFIDPDKSASAAVSPASVTNGVSGIVSSGTTAAAIRQDVRAVMGAFIAANNAPTDGVWVMSSITALALSLMLNPLGQPEFPGISMMGGTFQGLPVITSEYIQPDTAGSYVVLVKASDVWIADDGEIEVDMSREASLQMDNAPTGQNSTGTPAASQVVSLWQTNSVGFRAERTINWAKRRASAVALLTGVNWGDDVS